MMKRTRTIVFVTLCLIGAYALLTAPIGCGLDFRAKGRVTETGSLSTSQQVGLNGLLFTFAGGWSPVSVTPTLRGPRHFEFAFSENVENVRLLIDGVTLYDGPRIESFDASGMGHKGFLTIVPRWTGDTFTLKVSDKCTLGTVLGSFFRG